MCKHGQAVVEAGLLEAPAPVLADGPTDPADAIPSERGQGAVHERPSEGIWVRPTDHLAGCRWRAEDDITGRWVASSVMSDWYLAGRVAILADRPKGEGSTHTPTTLDSSEGLGGIETPRPRAPTTPEPNPADEGDVESDPSELPAWTDEVWTITEPAPAPPRSPKPRARTTSRPDGGGPGLRATAGRSPWTVRVRPRRRPATPRPSRTMFLAGSARGATAHLRELARLEDLERQASVDYGESYCW